MQLGEMWKAPVSFAAGMPFVLVASYQGQIDMRISWGLSHQSGMHIAKALSGSMHMLVMILDGLASHKCAVATRGLQIFYFSPKWVFIMALHNFPIFVTP